MKVDLILGISKTGKNKGDIQIDFPFFHHLLGQIGPDYPDTPHYP